MKKVVSIVIYLVISCLSVVNAQKMICKIKGSDTCLPLVQKESEVYLMKNPQSSIMVTGGGSGVGFAAIIDGTTDIAMASRSMEMDEKIKMNELGKAYKEVVFAKDVLTVIVNPTNKVNQLTREQLKGIFTGEIKNWKEVGGDDLEIVIYSRESSSGTYVFFKNHVLNKKNYSTKALLLPATGSIVQSVSQTKGAIGYIGFAYIEKTIKPLKVSFNKGKTFIEPSIENAKNKTYPILRPLYFYYLKTSENKVSPFINFTLSKEGQAIVSEVGYISL
jgi:phosphate transport system substrate-binding protein